MGCNGMTKEKLQTEILVIQLEKAEIQEQREKLLRQLEILNRKERLNTIQKFPLNSEGDSSKNSTN